jgi:hypothetical protein
MRRVSLVVATLLGSLFVHIAGSQQSDPPTLIVKITSSDADIPLAFTAAYVFC